MTNLFESLRDGTGKKLLEKYGDTFRITKKSDPVFSPSTGAVSSSTVTQDVKGKAFSIDQKFDRGEMVETSQIEIYLTANGLVFEPQEGMSIKSPTNSSTLYQIVSSKRIPESGIAVIYHLRAAR
jgi:hypothetical protein